MTALHPDYGGRSDTGPSPSLWSVFNGIEPDRITNFWEDFIGFGLAATNIYVGRSGVWTSYEDAGASIAPLATEVGGVVRMATDGTDNDEVWLQPGVATSVFGKLDSSNGLLLGMEARIRVQEIASRNVLVCLSEEGLAAADTLTDAGALADKDFLGFHSLEGDAAGLDSFYRKEGQTAQTVEDDLQTLVANTWYKVGLLFYPLQGNRNRMVRFFLNGVERSSYVTQAALAAATFPAGEELNFLAGHKNGTTTITRTDLDWVKMAQVRA